MAPHLLMAPGVMVSSEARRSRLPVSAVKQILCCKPCAEIEATCVCMHDSWGCLWAAMQMLSGVAAVALGLSLGAGLCVDSFVLEPLPHAAMDASGCCLAGSGDVAGAVTHLNLGLVAVWLLVLCCS